MQAESAANIEQAVRVNGRRRQSVRHTAAEWLKIIEAQRRSDLTVVEFCRRHGIVKSTFWYRQKRLATREKQERVAKPAQRFLAVPIVAPAAERIEVELGTMCVRLDGAAAARVVDAIVARVGSGAQR